MSQPSQHFWFGLGVGALLWPMATILGWTVAHSRVPRKSGSKHDRLLNELRQRDRLLDDMEEALGVGGMSAQDIGPTFSFQTVCIASDGSLVETPMLGTVPTPASSSKTKEGCRSTSWFRQPLLGGPTGYGWKGDGSRGA